MARKNTSSKNMENYTEDAVGDLLDIYLKDVRKNPLLNPAEEKSLVKTITDYRNQNGSTENGKTISERAYKKSLDKLVISNLRLVISEVAKYKSKIPIWLDLIQEGNAGLVRAAKGVDSRKKTRFSTYATWWIRGTIVEYLKGKTRTVRIPNEVQERYYGKYNPAIEKLTQKYGRKPNPEEIENDTLFSKEEIEFYESIGEKIKAAMSISEDSPMGRETKLGEILSECSETDYQFETIDMKQTAKTILKNASLNSQERLVVSKRFGLNGEEPKLLEVIGKEMSLTRERIRQIEAKAIEKMKHVSTKAGLLEDKIIEI